jgi:hypothetical protein
MKLAYSNPDPKALYPVCQICGWRKGGVDSWDGHRCKCRHDNEAKRMCTCHPDDNPPRPCAERYALSECRAAADKS